MKEVINDKGEKIIVTPETAVKTIDGKHYLLSDQEIAKLQQDKVEWDAKEAERTLNKIKNKRGSEYPIPRAEASTLWHYLNWMKINKSAEFDTLPEKVKKWHADCELVKINNPKPQQ